ncbi:MAG: alcohol dehydrogenase [Rhodospirillaceae bacterium]|nr:alcohol dehydrogenase [Rhodospirillaceae bacterium]|tara:strand:+ start:1247 stop:2422 length:1176 start_codon:yes stop_codon:yes gene_type:complete
MTTATLPAANWSYPTAMRFGVGRISELAESCRSVGITRPLTVTDPGIAGLPMISDAVAANDAAGLPTVVFSDIQANPVGSDVDRGLEVLRSGGHDGVIVFGGGSAMDAGKTIAFMAGQTRSMFDFEDRGDNWTLADSDTILPIVAVPTTSGTGSEVGRASVIVDESDQTKKILYHPRMLPGIVIEDPALTVGLPANITAWTGMDALAHCLEAFSAPGYHPMADGIALEGMRLVKDWLPVAVGDGGNLDARGHMQVAATMGATAFQKGLGAIHSLSHPIGALFNTHHGRTNAVVMPYVMAFNRDAVADRYAQLARYLDLPGSDFDAVMGWVLALRQAIGIEHTLADIGVDNARTDTIVAQAVNDPTAGTNPVPLNIDNLASLFANAMEGRLP